jgi:DNA-binding transcriptional MerR regulator
MNIMENVLTLKEVANITGVSVHTLRYYEKIGLLSHIKRDENDYRQYGEGDLSWIAFLLRLRKTGMPMIQMKQFSDLRSQGNSTASSRRKLLEEHHSNVQEEIKELEGNLQEIQKKIAYYKELEKQ